MSKAQALAEDGDVRGNWKLISKAEVSYLESCLGLWEGKVERILEFLD